MRSEKKAAAAMAFKGMVSCLNTSPMVIKLRMVAALQAEGERPVMQTVNHISGIKINRDVYKRQLEWIPRRNESGGGFRVFFMGGRYLWREPRGKA